jgi:hypothetical protein
MDELLITSNLMMGVLIAATAFCGLTGVVVGQIRKANLDISDKKDLLKSLLASFISGIIAILLTIMWFSAPTVDIRSLPFNLLSPALFMLQAILFVVVILSFWPSV